MKSKVFNQSCFKKYLICLKQAPIIAVLALQLACNQHPPFSIWYPTPPPPPFTHTYIHHQPSPNTPLSPSLHFHKWRETALSRNQHGKAIKKELRVCREKLDMISDAYCKCQRYYCVVVSPFLWPPCPFSGVTAHSLLGLMKPSQQPGSWYVRWRVLLILFCMQLSLRSLLLVNCNSPHFSSVSVLEQMSVKLI